MERGGVLDQRRNQQRAVLHQSEHGEVPFLKPQIKAVR
jgi:hypothetical protein